ncbi:hypothetical protein PF011_g21114, partial [Phytophthora fragariae]
ALTTFANVKAYVAKETLVNELEGIPATHVPLDVIKENLHGTGSPNRSEVGAVACVCSFLAG